MHDGRAARALDAADADRRLGGGCDGCGGSDGVGKQAVEDVEAGQELEGSLLESGLDVAGGAPERRRLEALVGEPRAGRADVLGDAGRAGRDADDSERRDGCGVDDADVGHPVHERAVEEECVPGA